jgi:hypothetical protein
MHEVDFWAKHCKDAKRSAVGTVGWGWVLAQIH